MTAIAERPTRRRHARPITHAGRAAEARRQARLILIGRHDQELRSIKTNIEKVGWDWEGKTAAAINYHLNRMEYHLEKLEAGL